MSHPAQNKNNKQSIAFRVFFVKLFLKLEAWFCAFFYRYSMASLNYWNRYVIFFQRFKVRGLQRLLCELLDDLFNFSLISVILFTLMGLSIFKVIKDDWKIQGNINVTFLDRHGNLVGQRGTHHAKNIPIETIPDHLIKAVLAIEDRRFFKHWGIDFYGLLRALGQNVQANSVVQGGSTLTQQLAKNIFLTNKRTFTRKIKEAFLALWLEANLSKKEILQLYFSKAYMGGGNFGIAAAAEFYFGKDVRDISLAEAAMLAGLFKAPGKYAPHINLPAARARANIVLESLVNHNMMSEGQIAASRHSPANIVGRLKNMVGGSDYFLDWTFDEIQKISAQLPETDLIVRTTLDRNLQKAAEESIEFHLLQYGQQFNATQAAIVILEHDGSVRAIVGGRNYNESQFNRATQAKRQSGSSFKPYVYAVALENGFTPYSRITDAPINWGGWSPRNYGRSYRGLVDLTTALALSLNTIPVRLVHDYMGRSTKKIMNFLQEIGIDTSSHGHKTMVLGSEGMTVMEQATGFNVFANEGIAGNRHAFTQILAPDGRVLWDFKRNSPKLRQVLSKESANKLNFMLSQVINRGTGRRAALPMTQVAGKTGTTQAYRDAWFVGFTGNYTAAVWLGNDDFSPMNGLTGGVVPAMIWKRMMLYAHQNIELKPIKGLEDKPAIIVTHSENNSQFSDDYLHEMPYTLSHETINSLLQMIQSFERKESKHFNKK